MSTPEFQAPPGARGASSQQGGVGAQGHGCIKRPTRNSASGCLSSWVANQPLCALRVMPHLGGPSHHSCDIREEAVDLHAACLARLPASCIIPLALQGEARRGSVAASVMDMGRVWRRLRCVRRAARGPCGTARGCTRSRWRCCGDEREQPQGRRSRQRPPPSGTTPPDPWLCQPPAVPPAYLQLGLQLGRRFQEALPRARVGVDPRWQVRLVHHGLHQPLPVTHPPRSHGQASAA